MIWLQPLYSTIDYAVIIGMFFSHYRYVSKEAVKITGVPQQRTSTGWFYNKLIKGRGLPWPHALLLVDERQKEWRWSQEVSLYDGSVKRLSLKRAFEPHQEVARCRIAITGLFWEKTCQIHFDSAPFVQLPWRLTWSIPRKSSTSIIYKGTSGLVLYGIYCI